MAEDSEREREPRPVRVQTTHGSLAGCLRVSRKMRTLDELNLAHRFLRVDATDDALAASCFEAGALDVCKDSILFVVENAAVRATGDDRIERAHYVRTVMRLKLGQFEVQGFLHVRGVRDPVLWLIHARQAFVALTAASIVGPGTELATAFIAVNLRHVVLAQGVDVQQEPVSDDCADLLALQGD